MEPAKEKPKFLIYRRPLSTEDSEALLRFKKALGTLGDVEETETESPAEQATLEELSKQYQHIFIDLSLADSNTFLSLNAKNILLIRKDAFPWNSPQVREKYQALLLKFPCLLIEETATSDLVRILHCFIFPKRQSGLSQLMEKGSTILGEKIQDIETMGLLNDRVANYLERIDGFKLKDKIPNVRQMLSALIQESFQQIKKSPNSFHAVDFQVSATPDKLVMHFRFPKGTQDFSAFPKKFISGKNFLWQSLWLNSDILFLVEHQLHDEIEVNAILTKSANKSLVNFRSVIWKSQDKSAKKEVLISAPANYKFQLISGIKIKDLSSSIAQDIGSGEVSKDLDLDALPESVVKKLDELEKERNFLKESDSKKDAYLKELKTKFIETSKELNVKQAEVSRLLKASEHHQNTFKIKIEDLEQKLQKAQTVTSTVSLNKDAPAISTLQETIAKLEAGMRVAESEKAGLSEKIALEQKRLSAQELKYAHLYKESTGKEKEIQELKALLLKAQKDTPDGKKGGGGATSTASAETEKKLRDTEAREAALKQELRKALFKVESQEKNVKAIVAETAEKAKLMEQKLQSAKAKEVELLKKIDDLSNALKKASKAA